MSNLRMLKHIQAVQDDLEHGKWRTKVLLQSRGTLAKRRYCHFSRVLCERKCYAGSPFPLCECDNCVIQSSGLYVGKVFIHFSFLQVRSTNSFPCSCSARVHTSFSPTQFSGVDFARSRPLEIRGHRSRTGGRDPPAGRSVKDAFTRNHDPKTAVRIEAMEFREACEAGLEGEPRSWIETWEKQYTRGGAAPPTSPPRSRCP